MNGMKVKAAISYSRFIAMVMIVLCHFFQFYNNELAWWFNVGVQIFLIISGFLYGTKSIEDPCLFYSDRCKKILIPYYIYIIGVTLYLLLFDKKVLSFTRIIHAFSGATPYDGTEHLWFVPYIMFCYFLVPICYKCRAHIEGKSIEKKMGLLLFGVALYEVLYKTYGFFFRPSRVICFFVGYMYSIQLKDWKDHLIKIKKMNITIIMVASVMNLLRIIIKCFYIQHFSNGVESVFNLYEQYSHVALGLAIFVALNEVFENARYNSFLKLSDKYSFYIYIVHHLIINSKYSVLTAFSNSVVGIFVSILLIVFSALLLYWISNKIIRFVSRT